MPRNRPPAPSGEPNAAPRWIAYYRVSTASQGASGLGLEAQRQAVGNHIRSAGGDLVGTFEEIESGRKSNRPQLAAALSACRAQRATLLVAKLDRLARNAHFLLGLKEAGVEFVCCDMPFANRLTVGVMALVAEEEAKAISARTKAALAAAKARGSRLGNPQLQPGNRTAAKAAAAVHRRMARSRARDVAPYLERARKAGCSTLVEFADALTARGVKTPGGCDRWSPEQVRRVFKRLEVQA